MLARKTMEQLHQEDLIRIQRFRLMDDDFFTKCLDGNIPCVRLILRIVLDMPDLEVIEVRTQVFVENLLNRSVRLDILAMDDNGRIFNIEIQRTDKGAGAKRARYNSSMIDASLLKKGAGFDALPETYVIFITEHDVIGRNLPLYHIDRYISELGEKFADEAHILYVNGAYQDDSPVGKLMHDFSCTNAADMHYDVLADRVSFFKESKEGVAIMCKAIEDMRMEAYHEGREEGREEGRAEQTRSLALRMLSAGKYGLEEISDLSALPLEEVRALQAEQFL